MKSLFDIKDYVVVITGGTGVLGRCIAMYLAQQGAKVALLGRKAEVGMAIVEKIKANGGEASFFTTDVMDIKAVEKNRDDILAKYGKIDTLLNAAGGNMPGATISPEQNFFDLDPEQFRPMTRVCGYAAAKAGISNFTAYMATEVAKKFGEKIRVNAIAPGFFITEQNRALLTNPDGSYTQRGKDVIRQTPFGRMGEPEELCGTIHYLMSDAAAFVTGTVAVVDGGFNCFAM